MTLVSTRQVLVWFSQLLHKDFLSSDETDGSAVEVPVGVLEAVTNGAFWIEELRGEDDEAEEFHDRRCSCSLFSLKMLRRLDE